MCVCRGGAKLTILIIAYSFLFSRATFHYRSSALATFNNAYTTRKLQVCASQRNPFATSGCVSLVSLLDFERKQSAIEFQQPRKIGDQQEATQSLASG